MARRYYSSTAARTTITGSVTNSGTSITVAATTGFPSSYPWSAILDQDTASEEVVDVTAAAGSTLTIVRGVDGTTAVAHNSGATFNHGVSAREYDETNSHVNNQQPHVTACTSSTRPSSPTISQIIFETDTKKYYGWDGAEWSQIGGPAGGVVSVSGPLILDSLTGALSLDGAAFSSTHVQTGPASVWEIDHSVSFYPNVTVVDSGGNTVIGDIDYVSPTHLTITFASAFAGIAYLS